MSQKTLQPESQVVYNTLYFQKLLEIEEKDLDIPVNQYLSRIVNLNLKSIVDNDYTIYQQNINPGFSSKIITQVDTHNNCLLSGFEIGIEEISGPKITFNIYPGLAIFDHVLIELNDLVSKSINVGEDTRTDYIVFVCNCTSPYPDHFEIRYFNLDKNFKVLESNLDDTWLESYLPFGMFKINRDYNMTFLSISNANAPLEIAGMNQDQDLDQFRYQLLDLPRTDLIKSKKILETGTQSLVPLYAQPKIYSINDINYLIPNYGKHVNNGFLLSTMVQDNNLNKIINPNFPVVLNMLF